MKTYYLGLDIVTEAETKETAIENFVEILREDTHQLIANGIINIKEK